MDAADGEIELQGGEQKQFVPNYFLGGNVALGGWAPLDSHETIDIYFVGDFEENIGQQKGLGAEIGSCHNYLRLDFLGLGHLTLAWRKKNMIRLKHCD